MTFFEEPGPRIFDIPAGVPFADAVASGVLARIDQADPLALPALTLFAPTRRGARTLGEAFVRRAGRPVLLPRIETLADLEDRDGLGGDLPPAISPTARILVLTRLVRGLVSTSGASTTMAQEALAISMARDLVALLDQVQGERLALDALENIVPESHAEHWGRTLQFLQILREHWPAYLAEKGLMDPVARRAELIRRQIAAWREAPPHRPMIVAGSTGSVGISAELIAAVARLPQGAVILPGLDRHLGAETFRQLRGERGEAEEPDHPQSGLSRLLSRIGDGEGPFPRDSVRLWAGEESPRMPFLSLAMRPAPVTDEWQSAEREVRETAPKALENVTLIEAETPQEEALAIAIAMRETLQSPGRSAALITPDRVLARRVSATLLRWGIRADDSAGTPLHLTPPAMFLMLLAEEGFADGELAGDPILLLSLLKHPLCQIGDSKSAHRRLVRRIEIRALRAQNPAKRPTGARISAIRTLFEPTEANDADPRDEAVLDWLDALDEALMPMRKLAGREIAFPRCLEALLAAAEGLGDAAALWEEANGAAMRDFLEELQEHAAELAKIDARAFPAVFGALMTGRSVRAPYGQHPRAFIWGTLEARMQRADRMILAGLNEEGWPRLPDPDPWMSRAMRHEFGLPPLERRIGLSSHDFQQAMAGPDVILSRARKSGGTPTVPSRWLQRMFALLGDQAGKGYAPDVLARMRRDGERYRRWALALSADDVTHAPCERPRPNPPVENRPRGLSVTEIETLIRDPYAIYAKHVLGLRALDAPMAAPDQRMRGNVMHEVVERFIRATQADWPRERQAREALFREAIDEALDMVADWPSHAAFYRARAEKLMPWFLEKEGLRRAAGDSPARLEGKAEGAWPVPGLGMFTLKARADRIDRLGGEGYALYDYKGASAPSKEQVRIGWAQQLPLQAAMLERALFDGLEGGPVRRIAYILLLGGSKLGEERVIDDSDELIANAMDRFLALIGAYANADLGYLSHARPEKSNFAGDYDHLARVGEWETGEDPEP